MDPQEQPQPQTPQEQPVAPVAPVTPVEPAAPPATAAPIVAPGTIPEGDINHKNILPVLITIAVLIAIASGIFWWMAKDSNLPEKQISSPSSPVVKETPVTPVSHTVLSLSETNKIVSALSNSDLDLFADFVSPARGVRISRDTSVNKTKDVILNQSQIKNAKANKTIWLWGYTDGKGDPIQDTIQNYLTVTVPNRDYINADEIRINEPRSVSPESTDNRYEHISSAYPDSDIVEYHFTDSETGDSNGFGWSSLYLILENVGDRYYLIGIVNGNWSI
ncbi:hypothetical protein COB55_00740 [Candidatus Wolfebacteria bacterium]|nr:MAG: hypothetical protein COB55_00740 [Candidatus Wolfebacteria bacterium]